MAWTSSSTRPSQRSPSRSSTRRMPRGPLPRPRDRLAVRRGRPGRQRARGVDGAIPVRALAGVGGARAARDHRLRHRPGHRGRARQVRRGPPVRSTRRDQGPRRQRLRGRGARPRVRLQRRHGHRGVPEPLGVLGARPRLVPRRAHGRARGLHAARGHRPRGDGRRGARGGHVHPALHRQGAAQGLVQDPARRGHASRAAHPAPSAWTATRRSRSARRRSRRSTSSPPRRPIPRASATGSPGAPASAST